MARQERDNDDARGCLAWFQKPIVHIVLIIVLGLVIYSNTLQVPFIFDDTSIIGSSVVRDLAHGSLPERDGMKGLYRNRVVGYLSFALNYKLNGLHVAGYHVVNILIHLVNALLVYWLATLTLRTPYASGHLGRNTTGASIAYGWVPLFTALLFVAHPVQTQAVTYIVQRFASLATLFYLLALVLYVKARGAASSSKACIAFYAASVLAAVLAMRTKEIALTLPVLIVLYEWMFFEGDVKKRVLCVLPFAVTLLIIPLTMMELKGTPASVRGMDELTQLAADRSVSRGDYLITQFRVIVTYLRLLFLPINQNLDYDYPIYRSFFDPAVLASLALLAVMFGLGVYLCWKSGRTGNANRFWLRLMALGIFWFLVTLSVESSVFPIADIIFEHRLYLPSIGFCMAFMAGMVRLHDVVRPSKNWSGIGDDSGSTGKVLVLALMALALALSAATYARNRVWRDEITLWEDVVRKSPSKARPHTNLGMSYERQGRLEEAARAYHTAIELSPDFAEAHYNLGVLHEKQGHVDEALAAYETALKFGADFAEAHNNLGVLYDKRGRLAEAIAANERAIKLDPDLAPAHNNLGVLYRKQGRLEEAIAAYRNAIRLKPDLVEAYNNLGGAYSKQGRLEEAIAAYEQATRLDPDLGAAHNNLGVLYEKEGRLEKAIAAYQAATRCKQDYANAHYNLGVLYQKQGRLEDACGEYQAALRIDATHEGAHRNLEALERAMEKNTD